MMGGAGGISHGTVNIVFQQLCVVRALLCTKVTFVVIFPTAILVYVIKLNIPPTFIDRANYFYPVIHHNYWIIKLRYYVTVRSVVCSC